MFSDAFRPPTDEQIDRLLLTIAASRPVSPGDVDTLVEYILMMRDKVSLYEQYITIHGQAGGAS